MAKNNMINDGDGDLHPLTPAPRKEGKGKNCVEAPPSLRGRDLGWGSILDNRIFVSRISSVILWRNVLVTVTEPSRQYFSVERLAPG